MILAMTTTTTTLTAADQLLDAIVAGGGVAADLFTADAVLDATVPAWRFSLTGRDAIAAKFTEWFNAPSQFEELDRFPIEGGELLMYLQTWVEGGVPHAAHHCHVLRLDASGRIAGDHFFCGGRWDAAKLAEMAAAQHAG